MPSAQTYASPVPVGFNNSGQIFGTALRKAKGDRFSYTSDPDCLIWTGTKFIDISPSLTIQNCNPYSINSENATGTYTLVGSYNDIYRLYGTAFLATITTAGTFAFEPYDENVYSELIGVNSAGTATGETFATTAVRLVFTTASRVMTVLQPACGKPAAGCIGGIPQGPLSVPIPQTCAFGGCTIDDSGRILGFDGLNSQFAIRTIGSSAATIDLPIYNTQYADGYVLGMNDAGQIPYIYTGTPNTTSVYDGTSATSTLIPPVTGTSCKHDDPSESSEMR
jgi:hypothetical protein